MYEYFNGKLSKVTPTYIVIELNHIGYLINVANPYTWSSQLDQEVEIYIHQVIREDAQTLYGFVDEAEKLLFLRLISVSGIGPKSALAIIAASDHVGLIRAIDSSDISYLMKFPGVGKKTAMQMALDLAGKVDLTGSSNLEQAEQKNSENVALEEAMEALQALGYRASELTKIKKKLALEVNLTSEAYIKAALKLMIN